MDGDSTSPKSTKEKKMFEQTLDEMTATIFIEEGQWNILTASNVGMDYNTIYKGFHVYTSGEAITIIDKLDKIIFDCPKYLQKRIRASRNQFVCAFGVEMMEKCGILTV